MGKLEKQLERKEKACKEWKEEYRAKVEELNELEEKLLRKEQECEELKGKVKELHQGWIDCDKERNLQEANSEFRQRVINRYKQTLAEIIRFFEEDEKFARYSGRPIIFVKPTLKKIEKILEENDIEIS